MRQHRDRGKARPAEAKGLRDNVVQFRVSDAELAQLRSRGQASGRSVPQVVRFCVFGAAADVCAEGAGPGGRTCPECRRIEGIHAIGCRLA